MINRVVAERYEILEAIGEGPLLTAFRARDKALNRIVAVKMLRPVHAEQPAVVERLRAGLAGVLSLNHPGITRVYDVGMDEDGGGTLFLAEEYVRGIDLKERIRRVAPFSLTAATDVAIALAEALEYAHARGVVHGDLRPQNILIGPEGHIKLTGWGTSGAQALLSDPDTLLRTVPYTAPDVSQGRSPTASGDLYALGVALYEMLTGDLPYGGDGPIQIVLRHAQEPIPSPRALNPGIPNALEGVVRKALGKRPEERYGSASEMLADLRAIRDALRYGKSLSWSPLDRSVQDQEEPGTVVSPRVTNGAEATIVMPTPTRRGDRPSSARTAQKASQAAGRAASDAPEPRESRWLSSLNLFMLALVLAGAAALAWMTLNFVQAPGDVIVPNLVGRTVDEAESLAREKRFTLSRVDEQHRDKEPENTIYRMQPEPGYHIREGKPVSIWVSKGPRLVEVPDVSDMSIEKAKQVIEDRGLRLGQKEWEHDPLVAKGNVLRQSPPLGERKPRGSYVDVVLSRGEEPPPPPVEPFEDGGSDPAVSGGGMSGDPTGDVGAGDTGDGERIRVFTVRYPVPRDNAKHRIRIDVLDKDGTRTVYDELREPGERVQENIEAVGRRITIKLYDNDELKSEQTK
jgi:serine/threonine-protein kinase